jgi:hypothetical protein
MADHLHRHVSGEVRGEEGGRHSEIEDNLARKIYSIYSTAY